MDKLQVWILRFPTYQAESPWVLQDFSVFQNFEKDKILDGISSDLVFAKACVSGRCSLQRPYSCCSSLFSRSCCSSYLLLLLVLVLAVCAGPACEEHTPWSTHWKNSKGSEVPFNLYTCTSCATHHQIKTHRCLTHSTISGVDKQRVSACKQTGWKLLFSMSQGCWSRWSASGDLYWSSQRNAGRLSAGASSTPHNDNVLLISLDLWIGSEFLWPLHGDEAMP